MLKSGRFLFMCLVLLGMCLSYEASAATVTTPTSANLAAATATLGGNVTSDGGAAITERGVVYAPTATNSNPLIGGTGVVKATRTGTTGVFTVPVTGLTQTTGYSFKAYAINSLGTSYSSVATFTTTLPDPTGAAGLVVTTNADVRANDGVISLRDAVAYANSGTVGATPEITFSVTGTITLTNFLNITRSMTITGPGAGILSLNGNARTRMFKISSGDVRISGLTLTNGSANSELVGGVNVIRGGAINLVGGALTLTSCILSDSIARYGGAIYVGGGSLTIFSSTISGSSDGSGIYMDGGSLLMTDSTVSGNLAGESGGGVFLNTNATATVKNSTVSGNSARGQFGGGGGFFNHGNLTITQSTISGNSTTAFRPDAGVDGGGGIYNFGVLTVTASTISANTAYHGGGIHTSSNPLTMSNSIVARNTVYNPGFAPDLLGNASGDYNILQNLQNTPGRGLSGTNNITGQPALLGPLANNRGPTQTHALLAGSPAINAGSNALIPSGVTTDQRGFARVEGGTVDFGALESDLTPPTISLSAPSSTIASASSVVNYTVTYGDVNFSSSTLSASNVTLNQTGTANATVSVDSSSGTTRTVTLSGMTGNGTLGISIASGTATDYAGNTAPAAGPSSTVTVDTIVPSVTINQAAGQTDPTISTPISFTVVFSEPVTNFTTGDVSLSGSAGATTATVTGSGSTYSVAVTGMTQSGTVTATIATGVALDAAANVNSASTSTDNAVSYSSAETVRSSGNIRPVAGGGVGLDYLGNPGQEYTIQFSPDLAPDSWQTLGTQVANSSGVVSIVDTPPAGTTQRFYRIVLP